MPTEPGDTAWYHGGDLENGQPFGTYLYLTDHRPLAELHAADHAPHGKVYRVRPEYLYLVVEHHDGNKRKVVRQDEIKQCGGVLVVFEEV